MVGFIEFFSLVFSFCSCLLSIEDLEEVGLEGKDIGRGTGQCVTRAAYLHESQIACHS